MWISRLVSKVLNLTLSWWFSSSYLSKLLLTLCRVSFKDLFYARSWLSWDWISNDRFLGFYLISGVFRWWDFLSKSSYAFFSCAFCSRSCSFSCWSWIMLFFDTVNRASRLELVSSFPGVEYFWLYLFVTLDESAFLPELINDIFLLDLFRGLSSLRNSLSKCWTFSSRLWILAFALLCSCSIL